MSRDRFENLWCIDRCAEKNGTYETNGYCSNCYREYVLVIPKGHEAPHSMSGWRCSNCGCSRVGVDRRPPAEPLPAPEGQHIGGLILEPLSPDFFERRAEEQAVVEAVRRLDFAWGTTGRWDTSFVPEVKAVLEALWAYDRTALARSTPTVSDGGEA